MEKEMIPRDMKDDSIIGALPGYDCEKTILNVGCGTARIDFHIAAMGYRVYATDIERNEVWQETDNLTFHQSDIFDLTSFPILNAPIVICSQVLEHLKNYKQALANLLKLTTARLILTFPFKRSFYSPAHLNFWDDNNIGEFIELCKPHLVSVSKIITKSEDVKNRQYDYLIIIDKRQTP
ncbi:MAG: methyltransferase domain-containing protein [Dehalococcoidia bacterium]|nr:methyltransferase domain-containing protein [Dehalococcoidia bacterium]